MNRKIKISIIEDDEFFAALLYWKLSENKQYEVTVFNDPDTFLNAPAKSHDVAVIDYHLGNSHYNGLDVAREDQECAQNFRVRPERHRICPEYGKRRRCCGLHQ